MRVEQSLLIVHAAAVILVICIAGHPLHVRVLLWVEGFEESWVQLVIHIAQLGFMIL